MGEGGGCKECARRRALKAAQNRRAYVKDPEKRREISYAWREKNPERWAVIQRRFAEKRRRAGRG